MICRLCKNSVESEFIFLLHCQSLAEHRNSFFKDVEEITPIFSTMSANEKFLLYFTK